MMIDCTDALRDCVSRLSDCEWIGLDTEFLRERTYYPRLCLVQISSELGEFIVDTVAIEDLTALASLLSRKELVKIIHACRQDIEALHIARCPVARPVFDTQIAAAFCGMGEQISYAGLVTELCGVKLQKSSTRTDWSKRPLTQNQIDYAREDVLYLADLYRYFSGQLQCRGRLSWHVQECEQILDQRNYIVDSKQAWRRLKRNTGLNSCAQSIARALAEWREDRAKRRNMPREWVLSSMALVEVARTQPQNIAALRSIASVPRALIKYAGSAILDIVHARSLQPEAVWMRREVLDKAERAKVKAAMQILRDAAESANISPALIANRAEITELLFAQGGENVLQGWRGELVGDALRSLVTGSQANSDGSGTSPADGSGVSPAD